MTKNLDISKIKVQFGDNHEPKDEKLIELFKKAYQGELLVRVALIKIEAIKPFSEFQPEIKQELLTNFENKKNKVIHHRFTYILKMNTLL